MPETALPNYSPAGRKTHQAKPPGKVHLHGLDTPQNAEAVMVAHVHGQERLMVLGDNGSRKRKRGASYFIINASRVLPH